MRDKGIRPQRILAVTFTNKAANEMKERLLGLSDEIREYLDQNISQVSPSSANSQDESSMDFDDLIEDFAQEATTEPDHTHHRQVHVDRSSMKRIGTFHSVFLKMLKEDIEHLDLWYTKTFGIYDSSESFSLIKKIIKDKGIEGEVEPREVKGFISKAKNEGIRYSSWKPGDDYEATMSLVYSEYQKELLKSNMLDFDDLLLLPYLLFERKPDILAQWQRRFDYIMVDEAQDTNRIQFELMKMLSGTSGNITLIGDDYQSIYGRRGALMENFLNVKQYRPDIIMFKLQTNYRSRPHIVQAGSHIIKNNTNQYDKDIQPHRSGDNKILVFSHKDQLDEAINIMDLIAKFHEEKGHPRSDFAILYRTNGQSSVFENICVQEGIPYKIYGAFKFFDRQEVKDIVSYLKYLMNPRDNIALKRVINTPSRKIGKTTVKKLEDYALLHDRTIDDVIQHIQTSDIGLGTAAVRNITWFVQTMQIIRNEMTHMTPSTIIGLVAQKIRYKAYLVKKEWNEQAAQERYDNIGQLINMAEKYESTGVEWLTELMDEIALLTDVAEQDEENVDAVKLMTVHASKWLEFAHVFVVGLEENIFPLSNARLERKLLEEERRLMYVAITRAEDHLFLSHADSRMQWGKMQYNQPSRFVEELPADLIKRYDLSGDSGGVSRSQRSGGSNFSEGEWVEHKLFGQGELIEIRNYVGLVRFSDPKYGLRKIPLKLLKRA